MTTPTPPFPPVSVPQSKEVNKFKSVALALDHVSTVDLYIMDINAHHVDIGNHNEITIKMMIVPQPSGTEGHTQATYGDYLLPVGNDIAALIEAEAIPRIGSIFTDFYTYRQGKMWEAEARLREYNITTGPVGTLMVDLHYTTLYQLPPIACPYSVGIADIVLDLPASFETTTSFRQTTLFRKVDWGVNAPPRDLDVSASDIGGVALNPTGTFSAQGPPGIPFDCPQMKIRMRMVVDSTYDESDKMTFMQNVTALLGNRNSESFLGFEKNTLYVEGIASQPLEHNFYEVVIDFVYDYFYEHNQIPYLDGSNAPLVNADGDFESIYWLRPSRESFDFNTLFTDTQQKLELMKEGWWEAWSRDAAGDNNSSGVTSGLC